MKKPMIKEIWMVNLKPSGKYCLHGMHRCVVINMIGSNFWVVPITSYRKNLHSPEVFIEKGRYGLIKDSKLKLDQIRLVSIEDFIYRNNFADSDLMEIIGNYLVNKGNHIKEAA